MSSWGHMFHALFLSVVTLVLRLAKNCKDNRVPQGDVELNKVGDDQDDIKKQSLQKNIPQKKNEEVKITLLEKSKDYRDQAKDYDG